MTHDRRVDERTVRVGCDGPMRRLRRDAHALRHERTVTVRIIGEDVDRDSGAIQRARAVGPSHGCVVAEDVELLADCRIGGREEEHLADGQPLPGDPRSQLAGASPHRRPRDVGNQHGAGARAVGSPQL